MPTNQNADHIRFNADMESDMPMLQACGLTQRPFFRELEVSDEHVVALLTAVGDALLAHRRNGTTASMALVEMQAALNTMLVSA